MYGMIEIDAIKFIRLSDLFKFLEDNRTIVVSIVCTTFNAWVIYANAI